VVIGGEKKEKKKIIKNKKQKKYILNIKYLDEKGRISNSRSSFIR